MIYRLVLHGTDVEWRLDGVSFGSLQQALATAALSSPPDPVLCLGVDSRICGVYNLEADLVPEMLDALEAVGDLKA